MLSITQAQEQLLAALRVTETEEVALGAAHGRVLAEEVHADFASPPFANSAMDGFAVRAADLAGTDAESKTLEVIGDIPAGTQPEKRLASGQAMRIMTGAPLPEGADSVIPVEDTDIERRGPDTPLPKTVVANRALDSGSNVRPAGQDFAEGQRLLSAGQRLGPQHIGVLAMLGRQTVSVHRVPKVAIFSSGDELVVAGAPLGPGQIYESNSSSMAAQLFRVGAEVLRLGIAPDDLAAITAHLEQAVESGADLILTSAGVSIGAHDYLRQALVSNGTLDFWRVNMRPGKPLAFGSYREIPYLGFPGNPVSAFVSFEVFGRPAIHKMSGDTHWARFSFQSELAEDVRSDGRQSYLRGIYENTSGSPIVKLTGHQGSGNLYSLVQANCLIIIPADVKQLKAGSHVETWPL
jgi:molybdopterin molybdotransferase